MHFTDLTFPISLEFLTRIDSQQLIAQALENIKNRYPNNWKILKTYHLDSSEQIAAELAIEIRKRERSLQKYVQSRNIDLNTTTLDRRTFTNLIISIVRKIKSKIGDFPREDLIGAESLERAMDWFDGNSIHPNDFIFYPGEQTTGDVNFRDLILLMNLRFKIKIVPDVGLMFVRLHLNGSRRSAEATRKILSRHGFLVDRAALSESAYVQSKFIEACKILPDLKWFFEFDGQIVLTIPISFQMQNQLPFWVKTLQEFLHPRLTLQTLDLISYQTEYGLHDENDNSRGPEWI